MEHIPGPSKKVETQQPSQQQASFSPEMLTIVSHEMRTPLTAITGYAATLLRHASRLREDEHQEFLSAILLASKRLEAIVDRLMELANVEMISALTTIAPVNVKHVIAESVAALPETMHHTVRGAERLLLANDLWNDSRADNAYVVYRSSVRQCASFFGSP